MSQTIYHYTSLIATKSIISSHSFRATNIQTFDDENELRGGLKPICLRLKEIGKGNGLNGLTSFYNSHIESILSDSSSERFHCISFCQKKNYDFMWNHYADGGCCLHFDKEKLLEAFLNIFVTIDGVERKFEPAFHEFIPCVYRKETDINSCASAYLSNLGMNQEINGLTSSVPFEFSKPNVIVKPFTWDDLNATESNYPQDIPVINIDDNLLNLLRLAISLKYAGTNGEYEKEKEERLVFRTFPQIGEKINKGRRYIELVLSPTLFFAALIKIQISPDPERHEEIKSELNELNRDLCSRKLIKSPIPII